jgi:hypothetical protein
MEVCLSFSEIPHCRTEVISAHYFAGIGSVDKDWETSRD